MDSALLAEWSSWLESSLRRFGSAGFGEAARTTTARTLREATESSDLLFSLAIEEGPTARGLILVKHARWEESVLGRTVAKVVFLAADSFEIALRLSRSTVIAAAAHEVVLLSASPGHSPTFVHVALTEAGFHVGSQALTIRADLNAIAPAVAKIPVRGRFRDAVLDDADAVAKIADRGFPNARFTSDPYFPAEWGGKLYAAWARNLVTGAAEKVVVAEGEHGVIGFLGMALDEKRRAQVPALMAVDPKYDGFGLGVALVRHMFDWYRERGVRILTGGTEKNNTAINALYARLGVSFLDCNLVYHASPALSPLRERLR